MEKLRLTEELRANHYPGRGIVIGKSEDGRFAMMAYFIMGRSTNSRNRIFVEEGDGIRTEAFDASKLEDPSLIIYSPVRVLGNKTIITNGDQTDTIYEGLDAQKTFEQALRGRTFEPDEPHYTPRISGVVHLVDDGFNYALSLIKSDNGDPASVNRFTFAYDHPIAGEGRFLHTYRAEDNGILLSYEGEPKRVAIEGDLESFATSIWESLDADNKVSLFVRSIDLETQAVESRIFNKNH